eukprot:219132-Pyramimonas_sp.AAC.1
MAAQWRWGYMQFVEDLVVDSGIAWDSVASADVAVARNVRYIEVCKLGVHWGVGSHEHFAYAPGAPLRT